MRLNDAEAIVEGVLFAAGDAVDLEKISDILDIDKKSTRAIITALADKYESENRGIKIIKLEDSYQLCTKPELHDYIAKLAEPRRTQTLSNAAMEVLSIVAYKQPVTRSVIEQIRGVSCDMLVNKLVEKNLIEEVGRLDAPGRPMLFGTTEEFLRCFGIESVKNLPQYDAIGEENFEISSGDNVLDGAAENDTEGLAGVVSD